MNAPSSSGTASPIARLDETRLRVHAAATISDHEVMELQEQ